jgi:hypothetical protein
MPPRGILGGACYSQDYAGMTLEQIEAPEDGDEDDEFGVDLMCEWYRLCQTSWRAPGSQEAAFIRAFEASTETCYT